MPAMKFEYVFEVSREDARIRLSALGEYLQNRHGIQISWTDENKARFTGKYLVVKIDGELTLAEGKLDFQGKDPGMLWRKKAVKYLKEKLETYLDPNTPPEQLPRGA
jgi:hypothetical protein